VQSVGEWCRVRVHSRGWFCPATRQKHIEATLSWVTTRIVAAGVLALGQTVRGPSSFVI
jgi:hypothetical protein